MFQHFIDFWMNWWCLDHVGHLLQSKSQRNSIEFRKYEIETSEKRQKFQINNIISTTKFNFDSSYQWSVKMSKKPYSNTCKRIWNYFVHINFDIQYANACDVEKQMKAEKWSGTYLRIIMHYQKFINKNSLPKSLFGFISKRSFCIAS